MSLEYKEISSKYTRKRQRQTTIEDLAARKAKRNHKKRHAVKAEIARFKARKRKDMKAYLERRNSILKEYHKLVKAYWNNEINHHPDKPELPKKPKYTLPRKTRIKYK